MAKSKSGTFIGDGTKTADLLIGFEPDVIIIDSNLPLNVAGPVGLYKVVLAKNVFTLNATHNSATDTQTARTIFAALNGLEWGNTSLGSYRNVASYVDGTLTVTNVTFSPSAQYCFIDGKEYTWTAYKA